MAWNTLEHTKSKVDRAGGTLKSGNEHGTSKSFQDYLDRTEALDVINNFRSSHGYPLHVITMRLRQNAPKIDDQAIVAQRLKRLVSIDAKLRRFSWLKLSRMQDIGGCRAVLRSVTRVERLHEWYSTRQCASKMRRVDNYIENPKSDGYRGIHYVYEYRSTTEQYEVYNGFQVEVQLRSALQHAWATATETVSTFTGQRLKGALGEVEWFRFFTLMANALAMREKRALVPDAPDDEGELVAELTDLAGTLNVEVVLRGWQTAMEILGEAPKDARVFLLVLNPTERTMEAIPFSAEHAALASNRYLEVEKEIAKKPNIEAVLVKTDSVAALRKAYPNYYVDMNSFLNAMDLALHPPVLAG